MIAKRAELASGAAVRAGHVRPGSDRRQHHRGASCASISRPAHPQAHQITRRPASWPPIHNRDRALLCNSVVAFDDTGVGTPAAARRFQRWVASLHARDLLAAEPALRRLQIPTLIVWGTGDVFFHRKSTYWLRGTIPSAVQVAEIPGARLFFPDERAPQLAAALRRHWHAHGR